MKLYTSDLHFYHNKIIQFQNRPFSNVEEMNDYLVYKWNNKVKKGDEVFIEGDFGFCNGIQANELLDRLNGQKFLIIGNHDKHFLRDRNFDRSKFVWIKDYATINDGETRVVLFHYPIAVWDCQHYGAIHLYGHVHSNAEGQHPLLFKLDNAYNVGTDVCDFEPKTLAELISKG